MNDQMVSHTMGTNQENLKSIKKIITFYLISYSYIYFLIKFIDKNNHVLNIDQGPSYTNYRQLSPGMAKSIKQIINGSLYEN